MSEVVHHGAHPPTAQTAEVVTDAEYKALEAVHVGMNMAERLIQRVRALTGMIPVCNCRPGCNYRDPALLKIKEAAVDEGIAAMKRAMRAGSGITEETLTRQQRYYP